MDIIEKSFKLGDDTYQEILDVAKFKNESVDMAINRALIMGLTALRREIIIKQYSQKLGQKIDSVCCTTNNPTRLVIYPDILSVEEIRLLCDEHFKDNRFTRCIKKSIPLINF